MTDKKENLVSGDPWVRVFMDDDQFLVTTSDSAGIKVGEKNAFMGARVTDLKYDKNGNHKPL